MALVGALPDIIGPYRIVRKLGEGGMGAVYEANHEAISRRVAIKVLHPEYSRNADTTARFFNEARAVNIVDHPGLVQVSDYSQLADGTAYIVMEFLKGESLGRRLKHTPDKLPLAEILHLGWQIADSLSVAHSKGIVHRDLKPDNVMIVPDSHMASGERAKIVDFGLAKLTEDALVKTRSNAVMGTPLYMSPEQCAGAGGVDAKTDVYALGCMLYEMLAGRPPFLAEGAGQVLGLHMFQPPKPLKTLAPNVPTKITAFVHRLLEKDKGQRPSMQQTAKELEALAKLAPPLVKKVQGQPDSGGLETVDTIAVSQPMDQSRASSIVLRRAIWLAIAVSFLLACVFVGGFIYFYRDGKQQPELLPPPPSSVTKPQPTASPTESPKVATPAPPKDVRVAPPRPADARPSQKRAAAAKREKASARPPAVSAPSPSAAPPVQPKQEVDKAVPEPPAKKVINERPKVED